MAHDDEWVSVTRAYLHELYAEIAELRTLVRGLRAANDELFDWLIGAMARGQDRVD